MNRFGPSVSTFHRISQHTLGEISRKRARKMSRLPANTKDWPLLFREAYEERAGIIEFQGRVSRNEAEKLAEVDIRKLAEGGN